MRARTNSHQANRSWLISRVIGLKLTVGLASALGALLFFAWLAGEVLEGDMDLLDTRARLAIHQRASPAFTIVMRAVTKLGSASFLLILGACTVLAFWLAGWRRRAALFTVTIAGAALLNLVLKLAFHRARPLPFFHTPLPGSYSFPSGHALLSFCFYGGLVSLFATRFQNRSGRLAIWVAAALLVALVGISRVYLGVHHLSDVLAGYAAAFVWVSVVASADLRLQRRLVAGPSEYVHRPKT
jgi:undecaprenyl-diphosphatase